MINDLKIFYTKDTKSSNASLIPINRLPIPGHTLPLVEYKSDHRWILLKHLSINFTHTVSNDVLYVAHKNVFLFVISVAVRMKSFHRHSSQPNRNQSKEWILVIHLAFKRWRSKVMNPMAKVVILKILNCYRQTCASNSSIRLSIIFVAHRNHHELKTKIHTKAKTVLLLNWNTKQEKNRFYNTKKFISHTENEINEENGVRIREFCNEAIWIQYRYRWIHAIHFTKAHFNEILMESCAINLKICPRMKKKKTERKKQQKFDDILALGDFLYDWSTFDVWYFENKSNTTFDLNK